MKKKEIKNHIDSCKESIIKRYGEIPSQYFITINLLEDTLIRYSQVKEAIDKFGICDSQTGVKNQLLSSEKDLLATIFKLTQKLGLSPYDSAKIKVAEEDDSNLLSALMGNDNEN